MSTLFRVRYTAALMLLIGVGSARWLAAGKPAEPTGLTIETRQRRAAQRLHSIALS
ncbi:MAG: hypothetical protein AB7P52_00345 [Alphaproteobacteria bacterium]